MNGLLQSRMIILIVFPRVIGLALIQILLIIIFQHIIQHFFQLWEGNSVIAMVLDHFLDHLSDLGQGYFINQLIE